MADGTFVAIACDPLSIELVLAKRTITIDPMMNLSMLCGTGKRLVYWHKAVTGVIVASMLDTGRAIIPIRTIEALIADSVDELWTVRHESITQDDHHTASHPSQIA